MALAGLGCAFSLVDLGDYVVSEPCDIAAGLEARFGKPIEDGVLAHEKAVCGLHQVCYGAPVVVVAAGVCVDGEGLFIDSP